MRRRPDDEALQRVAEREEQRREHERSDDRDRGPSSCEAKNAANIAAVSSAPCAKLMMCSTP